MQIGVERVDCGVCKLLENAVRGDFHNLAHGCCLDDAVDVGDRHLFGCEHTDDGLALFTDHAAFSCHHGLSVGERDCIRAAHFDVGFVCGCKIADHLIESVKTVMFCSVIRHVFVAVEHVVAACGLDVDILAIHLGVERLFGAAVFVLALVLIVCVIACVGGGGGHVEHTSVFVRRLHEVGIEAKMR